MKEKEYITPTKDNPVFIAHCDYWGYIEENFYKEWEIKNENGWIIGRTYALSLDKAIANLHEFIKEYFSSGKSSLPGKAKFSIAMIDGTWNEKYNERKEYKCYEISVNQARKFKLIK